MSAGDKRLLSGWEMGSFDIEVGLSVLHPHITFNDFYPFPTVLISTQCTSNVTLRGVRITIVAVGKQ